MSKTDDMRALREARVEAARARATSVPAPVEPRVPVAGRVVKAVPAAAPAVVPDGLCGHRAISGRTCTREQGHTAKSHRYA